MLHYLRRENIGIGTSIGFGDKSLTSSLSLNQESPSLSTGISQTTGGRVVKVTSNIQARGLTKLATEVAISISIPMSRARA